MTSFISLPDRYTTLLSVLLFTVLAAELGLLIYKHSNKAPLRKCLRCGLITAVNAVVLICSVQSEPTNVFVTAVKGLPWLFFVALILLTAVHITLAFPKEKYRAKNSLSLNSVREAVDDLPMGICFADPIGRIVLINQKMQTLTGEILGVIPQMLCELTDALSAPKNGTLLSEDMIRTADGRVYRFRKYEHTVDNHSGWRQITASDITERYAVGEQLRAENEKLKKINGKLQKMYERMSDDIREKESLELKIYVHDTIGRSILTVQDIMQSDEETEQKIEALREAEGVLSGRRTAFAGTMDEVKQTAAQIGVKVRVSGYIPADTVIESLTAAAARECVTNCVKHAKGNEITVTAENLGSIYRIAITNNGEKPKGKIIEGSGLSSLRRSVEASGGEMTVSHYPAFCLVLNLPGKENDEE